MTTDETTIMNYAEASSRNYFNSIDISSKSLLDIYTKSFVNGYKLAERVYDYDRNWISTSDKLPQSSDIVIITIRDDRGDSTNYYTDCGWLCGDTWIIDNEVCCGEVIGWMPLPLPWIPKK